ncbi:MAG: hypothetical protein ABF913_04880 [Oenococcus sp.]|uniref:hypothetical protein n=1 Tax=Oenococcus sp. TaxID=1979414 RepID=UPI0039E9A3E1
MSVENLATDWDHIAHSTLGSMGGRKYYFNEGDKIIPLCRAHHTERHMIGWIAFKAKYGLTDDDLVTLTDYQALDRNELHYQHQRKHKNKGMA